jgi:hypothetical protein
MAGTDETILIAYGIATVLAIVLALALFTSTRRRGTVDTHKAAEFEKRWLGIVVAILVALLAATIWFTPYGKSTPADAQIVHVSAQQFFWRLSPTHVRVEVPVAFVTRSDDEDGRVGEERAELRDVTRARRRRGAPLGLRVRRPVPRRGPGTAAHHGGGTRLGERLRRRIRAELSPTRRPP